MLRNSIPCIVVIVVISTVFSGQYHVSPDGNDASSGMVSSPLCTIGAASNLAQPGDIITVHEGVYRERINPPRGGQSDTKRITYQAAKGEKVVIKGSETIKGWEKVENDTWKVSIPNGFFGDFNPYSDLTQGDWFDGKGRSHHTGAVYLNEHWLVEAASLEDVLKPVGQAAASAMLSIPKAFDVQLWFARVDDTHTTIWAQFKDINPKEEDVEINVRQSVFYPDKPGRNYITVRGFTMMHAATNWVPPTAEQGHTRHPDAQWFPDAGLGLFLDWEAESI